MGHSPANFGYDAERMANVWALIRRRHVKAPCEQLESNWRAGWAKAPIRAAMLIHGITVSDFERFCGDEFVLWWRSTYKSLDIGS